MIITLTPNPSVDQTVFVDRLEPGAINRFPEFQLDPAGKGINVARMVRRLGWPAIALGFLGGEVGELARRALDREGVPHQFIPVPGQTRLNTTVVEAGGASTRLRGPGPFIDPDRRDALEAVVKVWLQAGRFLVLAGRLPPGVPDRFYATYVRLARERGVEAILDADGEPLRLGIEAGPALVKPNRAEAGRLLGRVLGDLGDVLAGAREIARKGVGTVVISLGAEGAVCVRGDRAWRAVPPPIERRSTVGPGDSFVAGLAVSLARGHDIAESLRLATAAGAATAMTPGTALGSTGDVADLVSRVKVEEMG